MKRVQVQYFALLREQSGCSSEGVDTSTETAAALYEELRARHRFTLPPSVLKVAINDDFAPWDHPLQSGDRVVFIPPVAGG